MKKETNEAIISTRDRRGNDLTIRYTGVNQRELAHFGGLDLHVTATKEMISEVNGLTFPEKEGDHLIREKVAALYLNEVGEFLRNSFFDTDILEGYSNIELVKNFLNELDHPEVLDLIHKDNELIQLEKDEIKREEDEAWDAMMKDLKKQ